jgi:hypothetical protein
MNAMFGIELSCHMSRAFSAGTNWHLFPGALPQAGMRCAFGATDRNGVTYPNGAAGGTPTASFIPAWGNAPGLLPPTFSSAESASHRSA